MSPITITIHIQIDIVFVRSSNHHRQNSISHTSALIAIKYHSEWKKDGEPHTPSNKRQMIQPIKTLLPNASQRTGNEVGATAQFQVRRTPVLDFHRQHPRTRSLPHSHLLLLPSLVAPPVPAGVPGSPTTGDSRVGNLEKPPPVRPWIISPKPAWDEKEGVPTVLREAPPEAPFGAIGMTMKKKEKSQDSQD